MTGEELHQIAVACFHMTRFRMPQGLMLSMESLVDVLNTHCSELKITLGKDGSDSVLNFYKPDSV